MPLPSRLWSPGALAQNKRYPLPDASRYLPKRAIIATSFSDIFRINCYNNGVLPVVLPEEIVHKLCEQLLERPGAAITIDLEAQKVAGPDGASYVFTIDGAIRERLLAGLDDVGITLTLQDKVAAFEHAYIGKMPWIGRVPA
jgi:3-isopropylmalate/(R)-2-methylmalate dehydratase small subunit